MKNRFSKILLIFAVFVLLLAACRSTGDQLGPDETYWAYYEACENGRFGEAELLLTEDAQDQKATVGICGFTHDAINEYERANGRPARTFSEEPELMNEEDRAVMTWFDDQGNIANVILVKSDDSWKIAHTVWST